MEDQIQLPEARFLHDIATPLSVAAQSVRKLLKELRGETPASSLEKQIERGERMLRSLEALEKLHAARKAAILSNKGPGKT